MTKIYVADCMSKIIPELLKTLRNCKIVRWKYFIRDKNTISLRQNYASRL